MPSPIPVSLARYDDDDAFPELLKQSLDSDAAIAIPAIDALLRRAEAVIDRIFVRVFGARSLDCPDEVPAGQHALYAIAAELEECGTRTASEFTSWVSAHCTKLLTDALQFGVPIPNLIMRDGAHISTSICDRREAARRLTDGASRQQVQLMACTVAALPASDRAILTARVVHATPWPQLATRLGMSVPTARRRLDRASAMLLRALRDAKTSEAA